MKYFIPETISAKEAEVIYKELLAKHHIEEKSQSVQKIFYTIDGIYYEAVVGKRFPTTGDDVVTIVENSRNFIVYTFNNLAGSATEQLIPKKKTLSIEYFS